jgi:DNA uptake protein ComE-like DNA-binding protein
MKLMVLVLGMLVGATSGTFAQTKKADPPAAQTKKEQENPYNAKNQLDVNSATKAELMKLPGVGDAYADAIIKNRPYANKTQIKTKAGVPDATYDKISDMIIAKQAK